jgi:hypothetical protein
MSFWGDIAGAGIGAVGSLIAGNQASSAYDDAANTSAQAATQAINEQRRQFDISQQNLLPFIEVGTSAVGQQAALTGLAGQDAQRQAYGNFIDSPGQQWLRDQQEKALLRNSAAIGGLGGGNVRSALQEQAFNRAQTDYANQYNRLAGLAGTGGTTATNLATIGGNTAQSIGNTGMAGANTRASGILGAGQTNQDLYGQLQGSASKAFTAARNQWGF